LVMVTFSGIAVEVGTRSVRGAADEVGAAADEVEGASDGVEPASVDEGPDAGTPSGASCRALAAALVVRARVAFGFDGAGSL
jgi:hypothetical protein